MTAPSPPSSPSGWTPRPAGAPRAWRSSSSAPSPATSTSRSAPGWRACPGSSGPCRRRSPSPRTAPPPWPCSRSRSRAPPRRSTRSPTCAKLRDAVPDGMRVQVTGPAGIEADLAQVFDGANTGLLAVTALVVAVLLMLTYRSPLLWLVPLLVVGLADRLASVLATQAWCSPWWRRTPPAWAGPGGCSPVCWASTRSTTRCRCSRPVPGGAGRRLQHLPRHPGA